MIDQVRKRAPLMHCITNYVTVNDVANMVLASGGSPIMADGIYEVEDITGICDGLIINIGTLNERTIDSMLKAGKRANQLGHPVIFDPVGAGASAFRTETARRILDSIACSVIRGNASEIKTIAKGSHTTRGVDANIADQVSAAHLDEAVQWIKDLSLQLKAVVAMTGEIDIISDGKRAAIVKNGHPWMSRITGAGCMLDGVIGNFAAACSDQLLEAVSSAVAAEGICGENAYKKARQLGTGTSSFRTYLIDEMSLLTSEKLKGEQNIEFR